jgi:hypothetical protein
MKKKGEKDKDAKKTNFEELIQRNLSEPRLTLDYSGFQFTVLNLNVPFKMMVRVKEWTFSPHCSRSISFWSSSISPTIQFPTSPSVSIPCNEVAPLPNLITLLADHNNIKDLKFLNA